jgi:hypothetical protein
MVKRRSNGTWMFQGPGRRRELELDRIGLGLGLGLGLGMRDCGACYFGGVRGAQVETPAPTMVRLVSLFGMYEVSTAFVVASYLVTVDVESPSEV